MRTYRVFRSCITAFLAGLLVLSLFAVQSLAADAKEQPDSFYDPDFFYDPDLAPFGSILARDLQEGMAGPDVTALQSMLYRLGYLKEGFAGYFDSDTKDAVAAFQEAQGDLPADGTVERRTKEALNSVLSEMSDRPGFLIYDVILPSGGSYTVNAMFDDGQDHEVVLSCSSPNIAVSGMTVAALSPGSAEVRADWEGKYHKFFVSIRDALEIESKVGDISNANNLWNGLAQRQEGMASYTGDMNSLTLFAGDCFLDERLFLPDFDTRFAGDNVYSIALSGSTADQWKSFIEEFPGCHPASLVLCIGTNDVRRGKPVSTVVYLIESLVERIHQNMPDTVIYWWNIMPHLESDEAYYRIAAVNAAMEEYAKQDDRFVVVDCYGAVTDANGIADPAFYRDPLHPNREGYDLLFQKTFEAGLVITQK